MKLFERCLLASDIDETLVIGGRIPQANFEKIEYFTENGGQFALASGRLPSGAEIIAKQFKNLAPCVLGNGTIIYDFNSDKVLFEHTLKDSEIEVIKKVKLTFPDVGIECFYVNSVYVLTSNARTREHTAYENMEYTDITPSELDSLKLNKAIFHCSGISQADKLINFAEKFSENGRFYKTEYKVGGVKRNLVEIVPKGSSKASGLKELANILKIREGGVFAIGDYYNDSEMIAAADIGAATKDAPDEVKNTANITVGSAENGAVADFIDFLSRKDIENERRS